MTGEITKSIVVDAPSPVVFRALTDERELVQWMPQKARMDARVGGTYEFHYYWAAKDAHSNAKGRILELVPNKKLSYTFASDSGGPGALLPESVLTWTLEDLPGGKTRVTLVHRVSDASDVRYSGWGYFLGRLAAHCAKVPVRTE